MKVTSLPQVQPKPPRDQVADINGDKVMLYEFDDDGTRASIQPPSA